MVCITVLLFPFTCIFTELDIKKKIRIQASLNYFNLESQLIKKQQPFLLKYTSLFSKRKNAVHLRCWFNHESKIQKVEIHDSEFLYILAKCMYVYTKHTIYT